MVGLAGKMKSKGKGADKAAKIVGVLFMSRTFAHMAHLKTNSYNVHMALNEFYDEVLDLADSLAEVAQGRYGKLDVPFVGLEGSLMQPADALEGHLEMILSEAEGCEGRAMNAIVDQIEELYLGTIYKLRELS